MRALAAALALQLAGCATLTLPSADRGGYALGRRGRHLTLYVAPGARGHRFQGTIQAPKGRLLGAIVSRAELRDRVALEGEILQFDLEPAAGTADGFEFAVTSRCARLELLVDGRPGDLSVLGGGVRVERRGGALLVCGRGGSR